MGLKKFIEDIASESGGRSDLLNTLAACGYERCDNIEALLLTINECRQTGDPVGYLQSHFTSSNSMPGNSNSSTSSNLRSGHAQKLLSKFNHLVTQGQLLKDMQLKYM